MTKRKEAQQERVHRAEQRTKAKFVKLRKINQEREEGKLRVLGLHPDVRSDELLVRGKIYRVCSVLMEI